MYFQFGIMTSNFKPIAKWIRYLIVLLPPSTLIISRSLLTKGVFKKLSIFFMIIILVTTPYYLINTINAHRISTHDFKAIYNFLKNKENKKIYIDYGSLGFVDFYFKYKRDIIPIESLENETEIKDSFVVINGSRGIIENSDMRSKLPEFIKNPSKEWVLIKEIDGPEVGIHKTFNPKIYYVK